MFAEWSRAEKLQLGGIVAAATAVITAALIGVFLSRQLSVLEVRIDGRMEQLISSSVAVGQVKEQREEKARQDAQ